MRYPLTGLTVIVGWETPMTDKKLGIVVDCKIRLWYKIAIKVAYLPGFVEALFTGEPTRTLAFICWISKWGLKLEMKVEVDDD